MARRPNAPHENQAADESSPEVRPHPHGDQPQVGGAPGVVPSSAPAHGHHQLLSKKAEPETDAPPAPLEEVAEIAKRYEVLEDRKVAMSGLVTMMRRGKVLDAHIYDVEGLQKQGLRVKEIP